MPILELPKECHPDFAVPNSKPKGPVTIDWDNPITNGLKHFFMPVMRDSLTRDGTGAKGDDTQPFLKDLVGTETHFTSHQTITNRGYSTKYVNGEVVMQQNTASSSWSLRVFPSITFSNTDRYTLASRVMNVTGITSLSQFGGTDASGNAGGLWNRQGTYLRLFRTPSVKWTSSASFTAHAGQTTVVFTTNGGGAGGSNVKAWQIETNELIDESSADTDTIIKTPLSATVGEPGNTSWWAVWDRDLSPEEALSFGRDPYQILKPDTPLLFYYASAGGGGILIPVAMNSYRQRQQMSMG